MAYKSLSALGRKTYFSDRRCPECGERQRYSKKDTCVHCHHVAMAVTRKDRKVEDRMPGKIADETKLMIGVNYG